MNVWLHSVWTGSRFERSGRAVVLDAPALIFRCPLCEYRMTALDDSAIRTVRRMHARTVHPEAVAAVDQLDARESLPRHLRKVIA